MGQEELRLSFRVDAELSRVAELRSRFQRFVASCGAGLDERASMEVTLALDEAATNIVRHAYPATEPGVIDVEYERRQESLVIRLWDDGEERDASEFVGLPPGEVGEGGMGINIMRATMTRVSYGRTPEGRNLLEMERRDDHGSWTGSTGNV